MSPEFGELLQALWLSGYDKKVLVESVQRKGDDILNKIPRDEPLSYYLRQHRSNFHTGGNFIGFQKSGSEAGAFIPSINWDFIQRYVGGHFKFSTPEGGESQADRIDDQLVVSDKLKQPDAAPPAGTSKVSIKKEDAEEARSYALPLLLLGGAAFAFLAR